MAYFFVASIMAAAALLRMRTRRRTIPAPGRPAAVDSVLGLLQGSGLQPRVVGAGVVSRGSLFQIEADPSAASRATGIGEAIHLRVQITAAADRGGEVAVEWRSRGVTVAHRDLMRQLGRATVDWRTGLGGRGVVVDPVGLRVEPFLFDLAEVVLPILREEPDRLAVTLGDAGRRVHAPPVGRGLRAY